MHVDEQVSSARPQGCPSLPGRPVGERARVRFEGVLVLRAMGEVPTLRIFLHDPIVLAHLAADPSAAVAFEEARTWLARAVEDEKRNGPGSAANHAQPLWADIERADHDLSAARAA